MFITSEAGLVVAAASLGGAALASTAPTGGAQLDRSFGVDGVAMPDVEAAVLPDHTASGVGAIAQDSLGRIYLPDPGAPFGGVKASGIGRELGPDALDGFSEVKNVFISTGV